MFVVVSGELRVSRKHKTLGIGDFSFSFSFFNGERRVRYRETRGKR
jgi:hypothetical protein